VTERLAALLETLKARGAAFVESPRALHTLFLTAMIEASLLPIPPDVPLVAMSVVRPRASFRYATVCIAGSVTGSMIGYALGAFLFDAAGEPLIAFLGMGGRFEHVLRLYHDNALLALVLAGFTNIPFAVFTLAAGFHRTLEPGTLLLGALLGRSVRFYLLALLLFLFGPAVRRFLDRYLALVSLALALLFVGSLFLLRE
jgi:membrane protein YqaA with SNARE-associated domain